MEPIVDMILHRALCFGAQARGSLWLAQVTLLINEGYPVRAEWVNDMRFERLRHEMISAMQSFRTGVEALVVDKEHERKVGARVRQ